MPANSSLGANSNSEADMRVSRRSREHAAHRAGSSLHVRGPPERTARGRLRAAEGGPQGRALTRASAERQRTRVEMQPAVHRTQRERTTLVAASYKPAMEATFIRFP